VTPEPLDLDAIRARAEAATAGPWAAWLDQDGADHMHGLLMVGNAAAVIPDGESYVDGVDVNPIAHTYTPEDREFIAHAREDIPALLAKVERLRRDRDEWEVDSRGWRKEAVALAAEVGTLTRERDEWEAYEQALAAKLDAVRAVHAPQVPTPSRPWVTCSGCTNGGPYPCPTIRALDGDAS